MEKRLNNLIIAACLIITGCTIDYENKSGNVIKSDDIPDSILHDFDLIKVKKNSVHSQIKSSKTEIFNTLDKTVMHSVEFLEYDINKGSVSTEGSVKKVEYNNKTEDAQLSGNIKFISNVEGIELVGETLFWNNDLKTISSDDNIEVIKDDGSSIKGEGFTANIKKSTFSFSNNIKGVNP